MNRIIILYVGSCLYQICVFLCLDLSLKGRAIAAPLQFTTTCTLHWSNQNFVGCRLKQKTFPPNDLIRL